MPDGLLLHACCAWCLLDALEEFRRDYGRVAAGFFNPNVHPRAEFEKRLRSARALCARLGLELAAEEDYGLVPFLNGLYNGQGRAQEGADGPAARPGRCAYCYELRLTWAARQAAARGLEAFSTTLLTSPHQDREALLAAGERAASAAGVRFDGRDLRALHGAGGERLPKGLMLHRQRYCGCVFSEAER